MTVQNRNSGQYLDTVLRMGCFCGKESLKINNRKYYEKSRLGEGGFSFVDLVEDAQTGERFALKRILCHSEDDEKVAQREIGMHRKFNHPNILRLEDSEFVPVRDATSSVISECRLLLPFYKRGTLHDELSRRMVTNDHMQEDRVIQLFHGICQAVKALHDCRPTPIAHRDLKPHNVLLTDTDRPILMDLGSADEARHEITNIKQASALQDFAAERCSMPYRAPELFNVNSLCTVDERTDIWSLGCTLYAMLYFKSPFDSAYERGDSVALAVVSGQIPTPLASAPYSSELIGLMRTMTRLDPAERPFIHWVIQEVDSIMKQRSITSKSDSLSLKSLDAAVNIV